MRRLSLSDPAELVAWDVRIEAMLRGGQLAVRSVAEDTLLAGHRHTRLAQVYQGLPVYGGELVRQTDGFRTISLFGTLYDGIELDTRPGLTAEEALRLVERRAEVDLGPRRLPERTVLPREEGGYALVYPVRVAHPAGITLYFVDARSGAIVLERSEAQTQSAVGRGTGVLGDDKKMSTQPADGSFVTSDMLRPPPLRSYDLKGDLTRTLRFLNGVVELTVGDLAHDADNTWTDGAVVDAHAYAGYTYDYYFKRFGRRGLSDTDIRMVSLVHPVRRDDFRAYGSDVVSFFYLNAFYAGDGIMVYGEGLPPGVRLGSQAVTYFSAGLDVVAHELTHGVTGFTSGLIYQGESGALNEAFSDMMGTAVEFFNQPPGDGLLKADYRIGEDVFTPGGIRSLANPALFGDPDHYTARFTGTDDNGGVHTNSAIPNQAYYLSIEGGTNRTSGLAVQGVGGTNREQIEKVFYRAFTLMLPRSANFSIARAATVQAARDLYGAGSAAERAVIQAWTAVGVN